MVYLCNNDIERQISSVYFEEGVWKSLNKEYDWLLGASWKGQIWDVSLKSVDVSSFLLTSWILFIGTYLRLMTASTVK